MKKTIFFLLNFLLSISAFAGTFKYAYNGQELEYTVLDEGAKTVEVTRPIIRDYFDIYSIIIPEIAKDGDNEYTVISIGDKAFYDSGFLTSIFIPESVKEVGKEVFKECYALKKAEFSSLESLCTIHFTDAYSNPVWVAKNLYIEGKLISNLVIPETVMEIGNYAFAGCNMTSVSIPTSVKSIGVGAFENCNGLREAEFSSIQSLCAINFSEKKSNPLYYAKKLSIAGNEISDVVIPEGVEDISSYAFSGCDMASVLLPTTVITIGAGAFEGCDSLTAVTIPESVETIGENAFNCSELKHVQFDAINCTSSAKVSYNKKLTAFSSSVETVVFGDKVRIIPSYAFYGASLTSVTIPESVEIIGDEAFSCDQLFDGTLKHVQFNAINCTSCWSDTNPIFPYYEIHAPFSKGLESVEFGENVKIIPPYTFYGCHIKAVTIPESVETIGDGAFYYCWDLKNIEFNAINCTKCGAEQSPECDPVFYSAVETITIGEKVKNIPPYAFNICSISSVTIPEAVETIGEKAFSNCRNLNSIEFNAINCTKIGYKSSSESEPVFSNSVETITFGENVKNIPPYAFNGASLTSVTIPESVETIGEKAFWYVNHVRFNAINCITCGSEGNSSFCSSVETITFGENVKRLPDYLLYGCREFSHLTIPNSVEEIGKFAFAQTGIMTVILPPSVKKIERGAFSECLSFKKGAYPNTASVSSEFADFGEGTFYDFWIGYDPEGAVIEDDWVYGPDKSEILFAPYYVNNDFIIPETVTSIGKGAFKRCFELTSLELPNSIINIGEDAFKNCTALTSVSIPNSVIKIGEYAFKNCTALTSISIPSSVLEIGKSAFEYCQALTKAEFSSVESLCNIKFSNSISNPLAYSKDLYIAGQKITDVVIPNSVKTIGDYAFNYSNINSVQIPNSVTSIGEYSFGYCNKLSSISLPNSVTKIGNWAFAGCTGMKTLMLSDNLLSIEEFAFYDCRSLSSLSIPSTVTKIGDYAFMYCGELTSVTIPNNVTSVGVGIFLGCRSLREIKVDTGNKKYFSEDGVLFNKSKSRLIQCPAEKENYSIPASVESIEEVAFGQCYNLISVSIPSSVTSIAENAFEGCNALESVYYNVENPIATTEDAFDFRSYYFATLYVPFSSIEKCREVVPWKNFVKIEGYDFSGVESISDESDAELPCEIFNLNGIKLGTSLETLKPGIYIVRRGDKVDKIRI